MVRPNLTVGRERWAPRGGKLAGTGSRGSEFSGPYSSSFRLPRFYWPESTLRAMRSASGIRSRLEAVMRASPLARPASGRRTSATGARAHGRLTLGAGRPTRRCPCIWRC
jgi:hypothetical protein